MTDQIAERLERLEADAQIRQLVASYSFDIDDRNLDGVAGLFAEDAVVMSGDRVMMAVGREAIVDQYRDRFRVLGAGMHFMHDHEIRFDGATEAQGKVSGHAELWRNGEMMLVALRYNDRYRKTEEGWKFAAREICYLYYVSVDDYPGILGKPDRNRAYATAKPADFPEGLPSWQTYHEKGRH